MTQKKIQSEQIDIDTITDAGGNTVLQIADNSAGKNGFVFVQAGTGYGKVGADGTVADVDLRLDTLGNGKVKAYDGSGFAEVATITGTQTLTNKRITPRFVNIATGSLTVNSDLYDQYNLSVSAATTINAPTGTPTTGQKLLLRILDNGTAQTLAWNAIFKPVGVTLPTTTVANKRIYVGMIYDPAYVRWDVIAVSQEA